MLLLVEVSLLVALPVTATAIGSPDDRDRAGRALTMTCHGVTESHDPWPGSFYAGPVLASLAVGTGACGYALRHITRRPRDEQERRTRALAITAAWGLLISAPLAVRRVDPVRVDTASPVPPALPGRGTGARRGRRGDTQETAKSKVKYW
ncbi:hypothetical protein AQJ67_43165 [Streptomyces caeruleatus]|uniref:Uncharacterized protein n=1 Tax=Streptomyces caeruleatus TaxID=661399 RepID=A0A117RHG7_9ACTN|nr:hypothetical protein AQJ67_43165 [Streptomyces caeruleatus]